MTFEEFLAAEMVALSRYARVLTGDRDLAHDVLADALIRAQLKWSRIGPMERPAAYVRSIITNGFFSEKRRWSSRFIQPTFTGELPETPEPGGGGSVEDRQQLDQMLRTLPRQQRAAIVLRYYLDLSDADIGRELRCSESAVRSYISRGLAAVREQAGGDGPAGSAAARTSRSSRTHTIGDPS